MFGFIKKNYLVISFGGSLASDYPKCTSFTLKRLRVQLDSPLATQNQELRKKWHMTSTSVIQNII